MSIHEGQTYECEDCDSLFTTISSLQTHIQSIHKGQCFQCTQCVSIFKWKCDLNLHMKSVHEGKLFQCSHCETNFAKKRNLQRHMQSVHKHIKNGNESKQEKDPKGQKTGISYNRLLDCPACDFSAISLNKLQKHTILNHKGFTLCKM